MMVFNDICVKCKGECNSLYFQRDFKNWTSDNSDIDKFIQSTQLSVHNKVSDALEWISYDKFYNIRYIAEDKFDKMYRANWIDGCIDDKNQYSWDDESQNWNRVKPNMFVNLKILNDPASIVSEFINKV
jgi:hypothetical protein